MITDVALEDFAIKFNRTMEEFAIAGTVSAEDALHDLWNFWDERILPLLPAYSLDSKVKTDG